MPGNSPRRRRPSQIVVEDGGRRTGRPVALLSEVESSVYKDGLKQLQPGRRAMGWGLTSKMRPCVSEWQEDQAHPWNVTVQNKDIL